MTESTKRALDELRVDCAPSAADRERNRQRLFTTVATGGMTESATRVHDAMRAHAAARLGFWHGPLGKLAVSLVVAAAVGGSYAVVRHRGLAANEQVRSGGTPPTSPPARLAARSDGEAANTAPSATAQPSAADVARARTSDSPTPIMFARDDRSKRRRHQLQASTPHSSDVTASEETQPATSVAPSEAALPAVTSTQASPTTATPSVTPAAIATPTLNEELALIARASSALDRHQPALALIALRDHALRFPNGSLAPERRALRVLAACDQQASEATTECAAFLKSADASPLSQRVRKACATVR